MHHLSFHYFLDKLSIIFFCGNRKSLEFWVAVVATAAAIVAVIARRKITIIMMIAESIVERIEIEKLLKLT